MSATAEEARDDDACGVDDPNPGRPPHLDESVRRIGKAGRETVDAALGTGKALRRLFSADFALARSAIGRVLAWGAMAIVFGASSWLLLMGAFVALVQRIPGVSWMLAMALAALVSLLVTALAAWRASAFFDLAGLHATRRQLHRLGLFNEASEEDEDEDDGMPPPSEPPPPAPPAPIGNPPPPPGRPVQPPVARTPEAGP